MQRAAILFFAALLPLAAQTRTSRVVINFSGVIDSPKIELLKHVIDDQLGLGFRKFTLLISSGGGDINAAAGAYNYLRGVPADITTFSVGNVYSSAMLLYCAGYHRYSLAGPDVRFLIQPTSANDAIVKVISYIAPDKMPELRSAVQAQRILLPEQAKDWGIVQEIRKDFMEPDAIYINLAGPLPLFPLP